jgi:hypothetical protein
MLVQGLHELRADGDLNGIERMAGRLVTRGEKPARALLSALGEGRWAVDGDVDHALRAGNLDEEVEIAADFLKDYREVIRPGGYDAQRIVGDAIEINVEIVDTRAADVIHAATYKRVALDEPAVEARNTHDNGWPGGAVSPQNSGDGGSSGHH